MSIHPSLSSKDKTKKHRSVLKRFEKIRELFGKGKWADGGTVFGLPKVKTVKIKLKKEKVEKAEEGAVAAAGAPAGGEAKAAPEAAKAEKGRKEEKPKKEEKR